MFSPFVVLMAAIGIEVGATTALPRTRGFHDLAWSALVLGGYALSIWLLADRRAADVGLRGVRRVVRPRHGRDRRRSVRSSFGERLDAVKLSALALIIVGRGRAEPAQHDDSESGPRGEQAPTSDPRRRGSGTTGHSRPRGALGQRRPRWSLATTSAGSRPLLARAERLLGDVVAPVRAARGAARCRPSGGRGRRSPASGSTSTSRFRRESVSMSSSRLAYEELFQELPGDVLGQVQGEQGRDGRRHGGPRRWRCWTRRSPEDEQRQPLAHELVAVVRLVVQHRTDPGRLETLHALAGAQVDDVVNGQGQVGPRVATPACRPCARGSRPAAGAPR